MSQPPSKPSSSTASAKARLDSVVSALDASRSTESALEFLGTLNFGDLSLPIHTSADPLRLPLNSTLLPTADPTTASHLYWLLQKTILNQDIFLFSAPGPYPRLLALTYCRLVNRAYEYVSLHRDVGEAELKQGREIREGGELEYVDSAVVRAAKKGSILILDGIQRAERGVLPMLNNLLENREINLEDGNSIISPDRYALMEKNGENMSTFVAAHKDFRIIAIGTPVPPYPGFPLDPPFRSRFQVMYIDPLASSKVLLSQSPSENAANAEIVEKTANAVTALQIVREMRTKMASGISSADELPNFPQTALSKLAQLIELFPLPHPSISTPAQVANVLLAIHPALSYVTQASWRSLETAFEGAGLGEWTKGVGECDREEAGLISEGIGGWELTSIRRLDEHAATLEFSRAGLETIQVQVSAGPLPFAPFPLESTEALLITPRFVHQLTSLFQLHALKNFDISILPPSNSLQAASSSTTLLISTFASLLGYKLETVHLYKELGGRELFMRRTVENGIGEGAKAAGTTSWEPSPLIKGALSGTLIHLEGIDALGATVGILSRIVGEREAELWEGQRLVAGVPLSGEEKASGLLSQAHPAFRIIATASKSSPPKEYLTEELSGMFLSLPTLAMSSEEEKSVLLSTGCSADVVETLVIFAERYRKVNSAPGSKARRLGTGGLARIARRLAVYPEDGLFTAITRCLLMEFLPVLDKVNLSELLAECNIVEGATYWNPPAELTATHLVFPASSDPKGLTKSRSFKIFDTSRDKDGAAHVPFMDNYLDNSQQTQLMRDIATDLEAGEFPLLLGNQGVGKNKLVDRLLQLLQRPREYIQLHRDTTTQSLMFQTSLSGGVIRYVDSPLLRAVKLGRVLVIDEVDKCSAPVVAGLASLASRGEMTLADGRSIKPAGRDLEANDIPIHPDFRLIMLANRPGYPFLGNAFVRVLGDAFSTIPITNPDPESEENVLLKLAPDLDPELLKRLVGAFGDLRRAFELGTLQYPYSLRELIALVRHLKKFPNDSLEQALRNIFDFDVNREETMDALYDILRKNKLKVERIGIDAVRGGSDPTEPKKKPIVIEFTPKGSTELDKPKLGKSTDKAHVGGNTWQGGTGGRDTAGLGGRGGFMRLYKGHDINQVSQELKDAVPDEIKTQAREMARAELAKRLAEIDLTNGQANIYSQYYNQVQSHVNQLVSFLDNLEANEEERVWLKRQSDGELDESRLTEGLTGESSIYKRRGMEKPEIGAVQLKAKRIRFIFDLSASMYRNQYDGRLTRSLEAAVMVLEAFARLSRKEKYRIDLVGQSGEEAVIPLVALDNLPTHGGDRYKVVQKMAVIPQYTWSGDHTIEAIEAGVKDVIDSDSDDYFVIIISDANFERYGITADHLKTAMEGNPKVKCALIAIGEGAEATWLPKALPGKAHRVVDTGGIATALRNILGSFLGGAL